MFSETYLATHEATGLTELTVCNAQLDFTRFSTRSMQDGWLDLLQEKLY